MALGHDPTPCGERGMPAGCSRSRRRSRPTRRRCRVTPSSGAPGRCAPCATRRRAATCCASHPSSRRSSQCPSVAACAMPARFVAARRDWLARECTAQLAVRERTRPLAIGDTILASGVPHVILRADGREAALQDRGCDCCACTVPGCTTPCGRAARDGARGAALAPAAVRVAPQPHRDRASASATSARAGDRA